MRGEGFRKHWTIYPPADNFLYCQQIRRQISLANVFVEENIKTWRGSLIQKSKIRAPGRMKKGNKQEAAFKTMAQALVPYLKIFAKSD